jgi:hypothetical protein
VAKKNAAAQNLARLRWSKKTEEERKQIGQSLTRKRIKGTTQKQRSAQASRAARARWDKTIAEKPAE